MSARYWEKADLMKWFQPERHNDPDVDSHAKYDRLYGPHLRSKNEDLDPYMQFLSFSPHYTEEKKKGFEIEKKLRMGFVKTIQVRVGMDRIDVVDHGHLLSLPLQLLRNYKPYQTRLSMQGFDCMLADDLLNLNVFHRLYTWGMLERPKTGLDLDVKRVQEVFGQVQWQQDPPLGYYTEADYRRPIEEKKQLMLMDGPHGSEEAKQAHEKKVWGGAKPKDVNELAKWREEKRKKKAEQTNVRELAESCEKNESEPEPESEEADSMAEDSPDSQIPDAEDSDDDVGCVGKRQRVS